MLTSPTSPLTKWALDTWGSWTVETPTPAEHWTLCRPYQQLPGLHWQRLIHPFLGVLKFLTHRGKNKLSSPWSTREMWYLVSAGPWPKEKCISSLASRDTTRLICLKWCTSHVLTEHVQHIKLCAMSWVPHDGGEPCCLQSGGCMKQKETPKQEQKPRMKRSLKRKRAKWSKHTHKTKETKTRRDIVVYVIEENPGTR